MISINFKVFHYYSYAIISFSLFISDITTIFFSTIPQKKIFFIKTLKAVKINDIIIVKVKFILTFTIYTYFAYVTDYD